MKNEPVTQIEHRPLAVKTFGITDKGRVRASNEDQFLIAAHQDDAHLADEPTGTKGPVRAGTRSPVSRGRRHGRAPGRRIGERHCRRVAIEQFTLNTFKWFFDANGAEAQRVLVQFQTALRQADERILEGSGGTSGLSGMGTTLTMAYHLDAQLCVVHVEDSRAYVYRDGELDQLTHDHTLVADMVRKGALRPDQAAGRDPRVHSRGAAEFLGLHRHAAFKRASGEGY